MPRKITIEGTGKLSAKPDYVVLSMTLEAEDKKYEKSVEVVAEQKRKLDNALMSVGFKEDSAKTTNFNVRTNYNFQRDKRGVTQNVFAGYTCIHKVRVEFDLDEDQLTKAIKAITYCITNPQLNISFTVRDKDTIKEELLKSIAKNARMKAETLCVASGAKLGQLLEINYSWKAADFFSTTNLNTSVLSLPQTGISTVEIEPDDIKVSDSAVFVWEIE